MLMKLLSTIIFILGSVVLEFIGGKKRYSDTQESRKLPLDKRYKLGQEFNCSCSVRILAICLSGFGYRNINRNTDRTTFTCAWET